MIRVTLLINVQSRKCEVREEAHLQIVCEFAVQPVLALQQSPHLGPPLIDHLALSALLLLPPPLHLHLSTQHQKWF